MNLDKEIEEHFKECYPKEGCGVIAIVKGHPKWFPCENLAIKDDEFVIGAKELCNIVRKYDILSIVHSHPDSSCEPSTLDISNCNHVGIPFIIYSYPSMEKYELKPKREVSNLIGREYQFGTNDCLSLAVDYYQETLRIHLPFRKDYKDDWWLENEDYLTEEHLKEWGFVPVDNYQKNDILIFAVGHKVSNHIGIALDGDIFLHHAVNRLSCRENLYPFWAKNLVRVYRYET